MMYVSLIKHTLRAAVIDDTGVVVNVIAANGDGETIIDVPRVYSSDGKAIEFMNTPIATSRWDGTQFVDLAGAPLSIDMTGINYYEEMLASDQSPPTVI